MTKKFTTFILSTHLNVHPLNLIKKLFMKKTLIVILALVSLVAFQYCSSSKKAAKTPPVSFETEVLPIMQASCTPCHFPPDGKKVPLNNADSLKVHIASVIARVKLPKEDPKYMPFKSKKPALTEPQIALLELWQKQNTPAK